MNGAAVVLAVIGVIFGLAAGFNNIDGNKRVTWGLLALAALHVAPLLIWLWMTLIFGGKFE